MLGVTGRISATISFKKRPHDCVVTIKKVDWSHINERMIKARAPEVIRIVREWVVAREETLEANNKRHTEGTHGDKDNAYNGWILVPIPMLFA